MTISARARARFGALRAAAVAELHDGSLRTRLVTPPAPPPGWCVALIARTIAQPDGGTVADRIGDELRPLATAVWPYPAGSLHISVVALTGREADPIDALRSHRLADGLEGVLWPHLDPGPFPFDIDGVGLLGTQLFAEVVPTDDRLTRLRGASLDLAESLGERPVRHDDLEPVHLNIARLVDERADLTAVEAVVRRTSTPLPFVVTELDVVITDFVVSAPATTFVRRVSSARG